MIESTALIKINPGADERVVALQREVNSLCQWAETLTIATPEHVVQATTDLSLLSGLKKSIEEVRKGYTGPLNDHLKAVNEAFKALSGPLEQADATTRSKILAYRREEQRKAAEVEEINRLRMEAARKEAALNDGEIKEAPVVLEVPQAPATRVSTDVGTLGTMKVRKWEVEDLLKVPADYMMIDAAKVGRVVRAGISSIPGIRIYEEETLTVRAR